MRRVRGRWLMITRHAHHGMGQERPPIRIEDIEWLFEEPDYDDGKEVRKLIRGQNVRAYYALREEEIEVRSVSRTSGRRF